jgi:hypothetical protein
MTTSRTTVASDVNPSKVLHFHTGGVSNREDLRTRTGKKWTIDTDRATRWANGSHVPDSIAIATCPSRTNPAVLGALYNDKGLSASQIAAEVGLSKTAVLERLQARGFRKTKTSREPE